MSATDPDSIHGRLASVAGPDFFEPSAAYQVRYRLAGLAHFAADPGSGLPLEHLRIEGDDNYLFTGLSALSDRIGGISIQGRGNAIFLGADSRLPSLRITIIGDGNIVYFGVRAAGGRLRVDVAGNGHLVSVGQEAMLARNRLVIGLGREIILTDAAGIRLSPASGRPIPTNSDIVLDGNIWAGRESLITEGVRVGAYAIVGARSVVVGDLAGASINTGAPARRVTQGITFSRSKAPSLQADQALSRHGHIARRLGVLRARADKAVAADSGVSLTEKLMAAPATSTLVAQPGRVTRAEGLHVPPKRSLEELAEAHARLIDHAGALPIELGAGCSVRAGSAGFAHIASEDAGLTSLQARGSGNYVFTAPGCDLSGLRIDLTDVSNTTIYFGPGVSVVNASTLRVAGHDGGFVYVGPGTRLDGINAQLSGSDARLVIGSDCLLDGNVALRTAEGFTLFDEATGDEINSGHSIIIENHVYVGFDSLIAKGAVIGRDSVVAPRSVVTGPLPPGGFHSGFPARQQQAEVHWSRQIGDLA